MKKIIYILKDIKRTINWWFVLLLFVVNTVSVLLDAKIDTYNYNNLVILLLVILGYLRAKMLSDL